MRSNMAWMLVTDLHILAADILALYNECSKKQKALSEQQLYGWKHLVDNTDQRKMTTSYETCHEASVTHHHENKVLFLVRFHITSLQAWHFVS